MHVFYDSDLFFYIKKKKTRYFPHNLLDTLKIVNIKKKKPNIFQRSTVQNVYN